MATRIENSRTAKRFQARMIWDTSDANWVGGGTPAGETTKNMEGRVPRRDKKGFPSSHGANTTAVRYTVQA